MAQSRHLLAVILAAFASLSPSPAMAQDRPASRAVVIFIDDYHIRFPSTPTLRQGMQQAIARLLAAGRLVGVVSDGPSSISVPPTTDITRLSPVANRVIGNGRRPDETANPTPSIIYDIKQREAIAEETLQSLLRDPGIDAILYVTERQTQPVVAAIPIVITRPEEMGTVVEQVLSLK